MAIEEMTCLTWPIGIVHYIQFHINDNNDWLRLSPVKVNHTQFIAIAMILTQSITSAEQRLTSGQISSKSVKFPHKAVPTDYSSQS